MDKIAPRYTAEQAIEADRIYARYRNGLVSKHQVIPQLRELLSLTRGEVNDLLDDGSHFPSARYVTT